MEKTLLQTKVNSNKLQKTTSLRKYSFGVGDRFGHQAKAQLNAIIHAEQQGVEITPVWNKSYREHSNTYSTPADTRRQADNAIAELQWNKSYFVDADHVNLTNVDSFIDSSNFFTFDVAEFIGKTAKAEDIIAFTNKYSDYIGALIIPGIPEKFNITLLFLQKIAQKYLLSIKEAGKTYRHVVENKGNNNFVTEISMDEIDYPQSPLEILFILAMIRDENIPIHTIAPRFTGKFSKGIEYAGNVEQFAKEFEQDLAVITFAITEYNLPKNLKLSIHSGSDKFSIYKSMNQAIKKFNTGLHLKTAGTTWLEELIGLAMAENDGLVIAKKIYTQSFERIGELSAPYAALMSIDFNKLPSPQTVANWDGQEFAQTLRHDQSCVRYNSHFRQLLHIGYKIAAEMGREYLDAIEKYEQIISKNVSENIYNRHIKKIFME